MRRIQPGKNDSGSLSVEQIVRQACRTAVACVIAAACLALAGCGGGGTKTLYAVGLGSSVVQDFQVSSTGALTANTTTSTGANPSFIVVDPQHKYAYVSNTAGGVGNGAVSQYTVAGNGQLGVNTSSAGTTTSVSVLPVPTGVNPVAMATDPGGKFLFVANQGSNSISVFSIDRATGILAEVSGSPFATGAAPAGIAATSKAVFVSNSGAATISAYTFSAGGALAAVSGSPFAAGTAPTALALSSNGSFLFAADPSSNSVLAFSVSTSGALAAVSGSPFAAGTTPVSVAANDKYVFVANSGSNNVSMFSLGSGGALSPAGGSPFAAGTTPSFAAMDAGGGLLYVANSGAGTISVFKISGGRLAEVKGSPFNSGVLAPTALETLH